MTDPIKHLRELLAKASLPPNEATAELIRALPALLDVAEAARDFTSLRTNGDPQGGRGMTRAATRMEESLAKLDEAKP